MGIGVVEAQELARYFITASTNPSLNSFVNSLNSAMSKPPNAILPLTAEQMLVAGSLLGVALISWWITLFQEGMMLDVGMFQLDAVALVVFSSSWTTGMIAMMFPTTVPMMLMFIRIGKSAKPEVRAGGGPTMTKAVLFIGSYIAIWAVVGVFMYVAIAVTLTFLPMNALSEALSSSIGVAFALFIVGAYQLSPLKGECLERCHPTSFLFKYYRGGLLGAVKMGLLYAKYCVGCCWVMFVFLLLVGAMGVLWMAVFAGLIFIERTVVHGRWPSRLLGLAFLSAGGIRLMIP